MGQARYAVSGPSGTGRSVSIYVDNMILYALGQVHPSPELLPEFARLLKENRAVCRIVYYALHQFPGVRRSMEAGGWLWAIANENPEALNQAFAPLLQDPDRGVRFVAARALVTALGDQADAGVFAVAIEALKSSEGDIAPGNGLSLLYDAARPATPDGPPAEPNLTPARLGPYLDDTVSALADAAAHTTRGEVRLGAAKLLEVLGPEFRKSDPALAAELEQQHRADAFDSKVCSGEATLPEVREGLKTFPKTAPSIARYYARFAGSNAVELLPAFQEALSALAPSPEAPIRDQAKALNARQTIADAMQKIAPELPKPLFGINDTHALTRIMQDPALQTDSERLQRVSEARKLAEWPEDKPFGIFVDVPPDKIRRLLAAMKDADGPTYDALAAQVKEIDPHFSDTPVGTGKDR
jgi:hypothetical protein